MYRIKTILYSSLALVFVFLVSLLVWATAHNNPTIDIPANLAILNGSEALNASYTVFNNTNYTWWYNQSDAFDVGTAGWIYIAENTSSSPNITWDTTGVADGNYTLNVTGTGDSAADDSSVIGTNVTVDNTAPIITLYEPGNSNQTTNATINFTFSVDEISHADAVCDLYTNIGGTFQANQSNITNDLGNVSNLTAGINRLELEHDIAEAEITWGVLCNDSTSRQAWSSNFTFTYDISAPTISSNTPTGTITDSTPTIQFTATDNLVGTVSCRYSLDNDEGFNDLDHLMTEAGTTFSRIHEGLSDKTYTVYSKCRDNLDNIASKSWSFTVDASIGEEGAGPSGGSTTHRVSSSSAGEIIIVPIVDDVLHYDELRITVKSNVENVKITVTSKDTVDTEFLGNVIQYVEVETVNLPDTSIDNVLIKFSIPQSILVNNNYDKNSVTLHHYRNSWEVLPTTLVSEDDTNVYYESTSSSLSLFAITAETLTGEQVPGEDVIIPAEKGGNLWVLWLVLVIIAVAIIIYIIYQKGKE